VAWWSRAFWAGGSLVAVLTLFTAYFFRNPVRIPPPGEDLVLAPGDGRILEIVPEQEPTFLDGSATRISIFLSIFNVHVQRAPLSGEVAHRNYRPGKYLAAWNPKASEENEQASLGIVAGRHKVLVRQIAGLVARRVVTDPRVGDSVARGERIGLIRFGSRVDLVLPPDWPVECKVGDSVKGGLTVLARIPRTREKEGK
jgi:phosphatidylserine decarboxylase